MCDFELEIPSLDRKDDILNYLVELEKFNSDTNGVGVFSRIFDGYSFEDALEMCLGLENIDYAKSLNRSCSKTFLFIRKSDDTLIGMLNLRWNLVNSDSIFSSNIGYSIRPLERGKGYNKYQLYLGFIEARKVGLKDVKLVCEPYNIPSVKTIESLGGNLIYSGIDPDDNILTNVYLFNIEDCIKKINL